MKAKYFINSHGNHYVTSAASVAGIARLFNQSVLRNFLPCGGGGGGGEMIEVAPVDTFT